MTRLPLDTLSADLRDELRRDPRGGGIVRLLGRYASEHDDWQPFARYSDEMYTRNLVHRCEEFELLLLAWRSGQSSPIHNHMGQSCWMAVLDGELEEVHFRPEPEAGGGLERGKVRRFPRGGVAFIEDSIALHRIQPVGQAATLHLYASAIDECRVYDEATGEATLIALGYHSVRGEPCLDRSPAAIRAEWVAGPGRAPG